MPKHTGYLIYLQFLGFRYSGWQRQPGQKTVEAMLHKTLRFVLPGRHFKILGSGRTDARVSALEAAFELFLDGDPLSNTEEFLQLFNENLPPDIRVLRIKQVRENFNIIKDCTQKEYLYFFACGEKLHPFCAPFMAGISGEIDVEAMIRAAPLYEGTHDFNTYTTKNSNRQNSIRTIASCRIEENKLLSASFFPDTTYVMRIRGAGFMRYQVRMIMGALMEYGRGALGHKDLLASLEPDNKVLLTYVAPGSGLLLNEVLFD